MSVTVKERLPRRLDMQYYAINCQIKGRSERTWEQVFAQNKKQAKEFLTEHFEEELGKPVELKCYHYLKFKIFWDCHDFVEFMKEKSYNNV